MKRIVDVQELKIVDAEGMDPPADVFHCDVLVAGGGLGGVAAAIAAAEAGRSVWLVEETDWLGGQATSQGVSALDENQYIETTGGTRRFLAFRRAIRDWYRRNASLKPAALRDDRLNPGNGWVSRVCFEPKAALAVIDERLAPLIKSKLLRVLRRCKACAVAMDGVRISHVDLIDLDSRRSHRVSASYVVDATELGDLLSLGAAEHVAGSESKRRTGEPNAAENEDPEEVQSFTYPFAIEYCRNEKHSIRKPDGYETNAAAQPYTLAIAEYQGRKVPYGMFTKREGTHGAFWTYRRLIDAGQFDDPRYPNDIAMINWPGNDYRGGNILVDSPAEQIAHLGAAKNLSLGLLWWLQHEVDRDDGGKGYPEFKLRPDVMGSSDGLSKFPYIRESRRLVALKTIVEQEIVTTGPRAAHFDDSVGIGLYPLDLHQTKRDRKLALGVAKPFQIPLGALIPKTTLNLLAGCKNIGTTHVTNGCYREHPTEWNVGEAAGETAAFCIERRISPHAALRDRPVLRDLQRRLVGRGVPVFWYDDLPVSDQAFEFAQMLPFELPDIRAKLNKDLRAPR